MSGRSRTADGIVAEVLTERCPDCKGKGFVESPEWTTWLDEQKKAATTAPPPTIPLVERCARCHGGGVALTEEGKYFVTALFAAHPHLKPLVDSPA